MRELFSDAKGVLSIQRVLTALVVTVVMAGWIIGCLMEGKYIPIGETNAAVLGLMVFGKAVQTFGEKK